MKKQNKGYILILGAKSDIAQALAKIYVANGYDLYLAGRNVEYELSEFVQKISNCFNSKIEFLEFDITDYESLENFYDLINEKPIGVISFIGLSDNQLIIDGNIKQIKKIVDTNFLGIVSLFEIIANDFKLRQSGFIAAVTSIAADRGRRKNYIYAASKAALNIYLSGQRNRLHRYNVNINTIKLGIVNTKMIKGLKYPKFLISEPETVARKIFRIQQKSIDVAYVPSYWGFFMFIIKIIPESIFKRIHI